MTILYFSGPQMDNIRTVVILFDSDQNSDWDTDRSKYKLLITFIHIGPHWDVHRDSDRY